MGGKRKGWAQGGVEGTTQSHRGPTDPTRSSRAKGPPEPSRLRREAQVTLGGGPRRCHLGRWTLAPRAAGAPLLGPSSSHELRGHLALGWGVRRRLQALWLAQAQVDGMSMTALPYLHCRSPARGCVPCPQVSPAPVLGMGLRPSSPRS